MTGFLASYWYFRKYDFTGHPGPLILDSGAFSAYTVGASIDLEEYAAWVRHVEEVAPGFAWSVNLDVIGEAEPSFRQWDRLRDLDVFTVPVIHHGGDFATAIDRYVSEGATRLCFGGLVGGGQANLPWAAAALRYLREKHPDVLTHGLGVVEGSVASRLPWDSTDSSAMTTANRFGHLRLIAPGGRGGFVGLDVRALTRPTRHEAELIRSYGIDPAPLRHSTSPTRNEALARLAYRTVGREEALENSRRATLRGRTGGDLPRPVTRYVVNGNLRLAAAIRDEMANPYEPPTMGPGVLRLDRATP